ncbi:MAG: NADPH:quinone reductase-like Zn-dependent oxidoreductase [Myxococcota bacterium]|jgi:NADPH:quinone reductase-like Zn-dependent oxidoreductase
MTTPRDLHTKAPDTMRALGFLARPEPGTAATALQWVEVPVPAPGKGEVRVRVVAAALNRDDVHAAEGTVFGGVPTAPRPTEKRPGVPGIDFAGVVDAVGSGVRDLQAGQRVFGVAYMQRLGSLAPYCCTKASRTRPLPEGWSFAQGAATGLSGSVASMAIRAAGDPRHKRCVVVGASGNIGGLIVQALAAAGAQEIVGVCSGANAARVTALGAGRVVDYGQSPWGEQLADEPPFDTVFDCVGGRDTEAEALAVLRLDGDLLTLCGPMRLLGGRRLSWLTITRTLAYIAWRMISSRVRGPRYTLLSGSEPEWSAVEALLLERDIRPSIDALHPFERDEVASALESVVGNRRQGKQVVVVRPDELEA